jgi:asparagine synthase (glutamine-hydrolysing)
LCGIAGFTHRKRPAPPGLIENVIATLAHRGPDHQGVFESNTVSLGAARLKIIDLDSGDQPMTSAGGGITIAFNGEIYNHLELRRELEALGHRFRSRTDTETVLEAFLEWDTACFARMRGMFAVALWIESSRRLVLARDRLGIKPLYLARHGDDLYFGSELKALFAHREVERTLSLAGLDSYLSLNYCAGAATLVEGIDKLPPGYWLEWRDGRTHQESYWRLPNGAERPWTMPAAQEELDRLLKLSVREHLASDVPTGVWLSGGVDSSTLLHYAAEASGSRLKTFSISFRGHSFDESDYIRRVAGQYGTEHEQLDLNPEQDLASAIEKFAYYSDEPNADAGALPVWFLSRLTKSSATVALSGEGADELFGGYLMQRASLLARRMRWLPRPALQLALRLASHWPVSDEKIGFDYKLKRFLEGCQMPALRAHVYWGGTFGDSEKARLVKPALPGALASTFAQLPAGEDLSTYLSFDQKYYLPDDILTKVDRMSMAHALEVRPPFLDHRIVEFANSLPAHLKIDGSRQKVLLKTLMRGKLPPEILTRKKIGFDIPAHEWFRGPLRPLLREAIDYARTEHAGFFRMVEIETLVRAHLERRANLGYHLWGLMILFFWMKKWGIQTGALAQPASRKMENAFHSIS